MEWEATGQLAGGHDIAYRGVSVIEHDGEKVHAFRRDELMEFDVTLQGDRVAGITLSQAVAGKKSTALKRPSAV